jgi:DNA-binding transcriptional MerR regulator
MSNSDSISGKLYYSMGDVAKMFDVNHSLIRYWEKEFKMLKPSKNSKGERIFTAKDIETLKIIYTLVKERGYTLNGAKEMLKAEKIDETKKKMEIVESLEKVKGFLIELKNQM